MVWMLLWTMSIIHLARYLFLVFAPTACCERDCRTGANMLKGISLPVYATSLTAVVMLMRSYFVRRRILLCMRCKNELRRWARTLSWILARLLDRWAVGAYVNGGCKRNRGARLAPLFPLLLPLLLAQRFAVGLFYGVFCVVYLAERLLQLPEVFHVSLFPKVEHLG